MCSTFSFNPIYWSKLTTLHFTHSKCPRAHTRDIAAASFIYVLKTDAIASAIEREDRRSRVHFGVEMGKTFGPFIMLTALSEGRVPLVQDLKPPIQHKLLSLFFFLSAFNFHCLVSVSRLNSLNEHVILATCVRFDQPLDYITLQILPLFSPKNKKKFNTLGA